MTVVLGIDGGGTRTRAALSGDGRILARGEHGSIKRLRVGAEAAEANLRALLTHVFSQAGSPPVAAATVGVASSTMPGVKEWITAVLNEFGVTTIEIVGDEVIALDAAFKGGPGILQIAGTGSNTVGRAPDGSRQSAGGWSSRLGDEGSGYWIGVNSLRRALHAYDREEPQRVLDTVAAIWGVKTIDELVNIGDGTPAPDFAALAPAIDKLAEEGDAVALDILAQAARDLTEFVLLVRAKLLRHHAIEGDLAVAWIGSVIGKSRLVRESFFAGLRAAVPGIPILETEVSGIEGALWRAERLAAG